MFRHIKTVLAFCKTVLSLANMQGCRVVGFIPLCLSVHLKTDIAARLKTFIPLPGIKIMCMCVNVHQNKRVGFDPTFLPVEG